MRFEIINPSDRCTMEADDLEVAAVACCFLGDGRYGLNALDEDADGKNDVPIFLLGGHDEWFVRKFGMNFEDTADHCMQHRSEDLARALESVDYFAARSSLNDIGGRGRRLAQAIRRKSAAAPASQENQR